MHRTLLVLLSIAFIGALSTSHSQAKESKVLYLGDSMSMGAFGKKLDQEMRNNGFEVYTFVAGGATPYYWLSRYQPISSSIGYWAKTPKSDVRQRFIKAVPKVETLVKEHNPDVVVIQTGTNLYATLRSKRRTKEANIKELEGLLEDMARAVTKDGRRVYWITPPDAHARRYPVELQEEMASIMKRVVGKYGSVFDSRKVTKFTDPYPKTDGIHYGAEEATVWAQVVANDFNKFMSYGQPTLIASNSPDAGKAEASMQASKKAIAIENMLKETLVIDEPVVAKIDSTPKEEFAHPEEIVKAEEISESEAQLILKESEIVPPSEWGQLEVTMRLVRKSYVEHLSNVTYEHCFVLYEYEVINVKGNYPYKHIRIAETGVYKRKKQPALDYEIGKIRSMKIDPLSFYPNLEQWQLNDELPTRIELPIYIASMRD